MSDTLIPALAAAVSPATGLAAAPVQLAGAGGRESAVAALTLGPAAASSCRRRVHLDHDPDLDRRSVAVSDPAGSFIRAEIAVHRRSLAETVLLPGVRREERLTAGNLTAIIDLLLPVDGGYLPVLIKGHRTLEPGEGALVSAAADPLNRVVAPELRGRARSDDMMALAHCHRLLTALGMAAPGPALGGVMGRGNPDDQVILWHRLDAGERTPLDEYDDRIADRLAVADAAARRAPALAWPSRVGECRRCPWDALCGAALAAGNDVSLIAPGADAEQLRSVGVHTIDQLAGADEAQLAVVADSRLTGAVRGPELRDRARAWLSGSALVRRREHVLVPRADIEVDVDMECFIDDGAYLWGTFLDGTASGLARAHEFGFEAGYQPFVTWSPLPSPAEGEAFADFWGYLRELRALAAAHGLSFAAYCYSRQAEERWLLSTPQRYPQVEGMPTVAEVRQFIASDDWVDMYEVIGNEFVAAGSKRLKALAPSAGFSWRDAEPDGANSMVWYRGAVGSADTPPDPSLKRRLLEYNEDDVRATRALRLWMSGPDVTKVPTVAELVPTGSRSLP